MQVINHETHREIRSRNHKQLKKLELSYRKEGRETQMVYFDTCDKIWSLRIRDLNKSTLNSEQVGFKP